MNGIEEHAYRVLEITVPILLFMWSNKRKAKKEREKQHKENQDKIGKLLQECELLPLHGHSETKGVLRAENIFPKRNLS